MEQNIDSLTLFIEKVRTVGWFQRLFRWRSILDSLTDAIADLSRFLATHSSITSALSSTKDVNIKMSSELDQLRERCGRLDAEVESLSSLNSANQEQLIGLRSSLSSTETAASGYVQRIAQLEGEVRLALEKGETLERQRDDYFEELTTTRETATNLASRKHQLEADNQALMARAEIQTRERDELREKVTQFSTEEDGRRSDYERGLSNLAEIKEQIQGERSAEVAERSELEIARIEGLKEKWRLHQNDVESAIRNHCSKHVIEYVENVPFKGNPDNTIKICDEYIVFDAKSPGSEDLKNFPLYLKAQAEAAKKYASIEGVKPEVFFVVPSNTLDTLRQFVYHLGNFNAYVVSLDSLEPVILSLKRIEDYEFADVLSPEDRDAVCRILGGFVHMTKRRIQVDNFFVQTAFELVARHEQELPIDFVHKIIEVERAARLNPPTEKRSKRIDLVELQEKSRMLAIQSQLRGIPLEVGPLLAGLDETDLTDVSSPVSDTVSYDGDPQE